MTSPSPDSAADQVYHVAFESDWVAAQQTGDYRMSTVGRTLDDEGFIHASYPHQLAAVLSRFYGAVTEPLVLLHVDVGAVPIVVEPAAPGGALGATETELYPHVYGPIPVAAVVGTHRLNRRADGTFEVPDL